MTTPTRIDRAMAARMSLQEIGELLVSPTASLIPLICAFPQVSAAWTSR